MSGKPATEAVIELLACDCKRICKKPDCPCLENESNVQTCAN